MTTMTRASRSSDESDVYDDIPIRRTRAMTRRRSHQPMQVAPLDQGNASDDDDDDDDRVIVGVNDDEDDVTNDDDVSNENDVDEFYNDDSNGLRDSIEEDDNYPKADDDIHGSAEADIPAEVDIRPDVPDPAVVDSPPRGDAPASPAPNVEVPGPRRSRRTRAPPTRFKDYVSHAHICNLARANNVDKTILELFISSHQVLLNMILSSSRI
jgi:hypothetical protein